MSGQLRPLPETPAIRIVVIGASAGGLRAIKLVLSQLHQDIPAAILVVQHLAPWYRSELAAILGAHSRMVVKEAEEGDPLREGTVYVAPPNRHLLVSPDGTITLSFAELVHFVRPSADLLFESAAASFKSRTVGVVLSGTGVDGAMGVKAIKRMGGLVIAQDQSSSEFFGMPSAAIETGDVDFVLPLEEIGEKLAKLLAGEQVP